MKTKYVTMEQIIAGAILTFGNITKSKLDFILESFDLYMKGFVIGTDVSKLANYISYEDEIIKLKDEFVINPSVEEYFRALAGKDILNFFSFLTKKGCVNCYNQDCLLTKGERNLLNDFNYLVGNDCLDYYNEPLVESILIRTKKAK
ncbi:MAG: hypothetical protein RSE17_02160 [Bacilli bacterium]